jgi:hypothetical protein
MDVLRDRIVHDEGGLMQPTVSRAQVASIDVASGC